MKHIFKPDPANKVNILLYHQIGNEPNKHTNLDCFCDLKEFYNQMEFLANSRYHVISLTKALDLIFNKRVIDNNYIVLTFDDGCERFYDITFPILEKFRFPSTVYPVSGYLGKYASWGTIKNPDLKILSQSMLIELHKLGVEIGAHTMDHVKLPCIERNDAINQVRGCKIALEQLLGEKVHSFAYPHGDFNEKVIEIVKEAEFTCALTCLNGYAEDAKSVFEIPRKYITYFDNMENFNQKLN
jgi:peptidoglycan/xylan/chitin deacetylase (PgdA/CDA1 family)